MSYQPQSSSFTQQYRENFQSEGFLPDGFVLHNLTNGDKFAYSHDVHNMDSTLNAGGQEEYVLLAPQTEKPFHRVIILTALLPEADNNNYLYWAKTLAIQTGKPVIICLNQKNEFEDSQQVFQQIYKSIEQLKNLAEKIQHNEIPVLSGQSQFDFFAFGLGTVIARCLVEEICVDLFAQSKTFLLLDDEAFSSVSWVKNNLSTWADFLAMQPQNADCDILQKMQPMVDGSTESLRPFNANRYFVLNVKTAQKKFVRDDASTYRGPDNSIPVSYITLPVEYSFNADDLFPTSVSSDDANIYGGYLTVFKMASWFLCGIN